MKQEHQCQACGWFGETEHTCPQCGGQDWEPAAPKSEPAPAPEPPPVPVVLSTKPVSPSPTKSSRR